MAKSEWRSRLVQQQLNMAKTKYLKIKAYFFEISYVVSYIYVLAVMLSATVPPS